MGRPERPLNRNVGSATRLAAELRDLRREAGDPPYRQMAQRAHFSAATLARAASGTALPSLAVTLAYAEACGADRTSWERRWRSARAEVEGGVAFDLAPGAQPSRPAPTEIGGSGGPGFSRPAQLPKAPAVFVGREAELAGFDAAVVAGQSAAGTVIVVSGMAGAGKSALALHWARRRVDQYPDGQLYIGLRGFATGSLPVAPAHAERSFLSALAGTSQPLPGDPDALAALYRSRLAGQRMLIMLDDARNAGQVRPLLPGSSSCTVVITSRDKLAGLVAIEGAHHVTLGPLTPGEAMELLTRRLGADRVAAEPGAALDIISLCGFLPLAVNIATAHAVLDSSRPLADIAAQLRNPHDRLTALNLSDPSADVRSVLSTSVRSLSPQARALFRALGSHPGPAMSLSAAASLGGVARDTAARYLGELDYLNLVDLPRREQVILHDLVHIYAAETAKADPPPEGADRAAIRMLGHYLHSARAADRVLNPRRGNIAVAPPADGAVIEFFPSAQSALAWCRREHINLLAAIRYARDNGYDTHVWQLAWALATYLLRSGHTEDWISSQRSALSAVRRLGDGTAQARIHLGLSRAYATSGQFSLAVRHVHKALAIYSLDHDRIGQARCHLSLNLIHTRQDRHDLAVSHARKALDLFAAAGERHGQAAAHSAIGWLYALRHDQAQATAHCIRAIELFRALGDAAGEAAAQDSLGKVHADAGHYKEAISRYQQAAALNSRAGAPRNQAQSLIPLGDCHFACGDEQAARKAWQSASDILNELRQPADTARRKLALLDNKLR